MMALFFQAPKIIIFASFVRVMVFFWILAGLVWLGGVISIMTEMIRNRGTNFAKMRTRLAQNSEQSSEPESQKIDLSQNGQTFVPNGDPVRNENSIQNGNQKIPLGRYLKQKITKRGVKMTVEIKIIFLFHNNIILNSIIFTRIF